MTEKPHLSIVPKRDPTPKEAVIERIKAMPRPEGMIQCPHCGGRAKLTIEAGAMVVKGKLKKGTIIHRDICAACWKRRDVAVQMKSGLERPEIV